MMGKHKWSSVAIFLSFESIVKSICLVFILYTVNSEINAWIYYCKFSITDNNAKLINAIGIHVVIEY